MGRGESVLTDVPRHATTVFTLGGSAWRQLTKPDVVDLVLVLRRAAALRAKLPPMDGVALARESRADLEVRGA